MLTIGYVNAVNYIHKPFGSKSVNYPLIIPLFQPTPLEGQIFYHFLKLSDYFDANKLPFVGHSYISGVRISSAVQRVPTSWSFCTTQAGLSSLQNSSKLYSLKNNNTVLYEVTKTGEHDYAAESQPTRFLFTDTAIKPGPNSVGSVGQEWCDGQRTAE